MKHLIKNGKVVMSGIPGHFTRKNGERFFGGYQNRTDLHYADGWRDEEIPATFDSRVEKLVNQRFDPEKDKVVYDAAPLDLDLEVERKRLLTENDIQQRNLLFDTDPYITRSNDPTSSAAIPQWVIDERTAIRVRHDQIEADILALTEVRDLITYQINYN